MRWFDPRDRDERGGVIVMSVVFLTLVMLLTSLVIDVGIARIVRTDVQSLADTTALDMAASLDGTATKSQLLDPSTPAGTKFAAAKSKTLARNKSSVGGNVSVDDVTVTLGMADSNGKWQGEAAAAQSPNAVRVTVAGTTKTQLLPGVGTARPVRTAEAVREPKAACITVGSFLGALDTSNGGTLLAKLLNEVAPTSVDIFSATGLVALKGLSVPLVDLAAELHVADPSKLLDTTVTLAELARASAVVLGHQSGSAAAVSALNAISANASAVGSTIKLGDILAVGSSNAAGALAGNINVFDLVTSSVFAIDSNHVVNLQNLGLAIPGFDTVALNATIVNPPKTVCGGPGSEVTNSQVKLDVDLSIRLDKYQKCRNLDLICGLNNLATGILGVLVPGSKWKSDGSEVATLKLELKAVNASAKITAVGSCEPSPSVDVAVTTSLTDGQLSVRALSDLINVRVNIPQATASTTSQHFSSSPASMTHVGGLGTNLIGPIDLGAALLTQDKEQSLVVNVGAPGISLGSQLTTALNNALSGLGLSLNGANVSLSKMGKCDGFGLRK